MKTATSTANDAHATPCECPHCVDDVVTRMHRRHARKAHERLAAAVQQLLLTLKVTELNDAQVEAVKRLLPLLPVRQVTTTEGQILPRRY